MPTLSRTVLATTRPSFLLLSLVSAALGLASGASTGHPNDPASAALALLGALSAHAAVNLHNEWHDFRSGLDASTRRTPFSGGSGALVANPSAARATLPAAALLASMTAPLAAFVARHAVRNADDLETLIPAMAGNVALSLVTPLLLAGALWWSAG